MSFTPTPSKARRGLAAWIAFGVAGLACGAVWATGFASVGGANGTNHTSPIVAPSDPADHNPALSGVVTGGSPLTVDWNGRWGSVSADTNFFTVDLSGEPAGQTYNVAFLLTNTTDISGTGWSSLQLKVEEVDAGTSGPCDATAFDGTQNPKVMAFDSPFSNAPVSQLPFSNAVAVCWTSPTLVKVTVVPGTCGAGRLATSVTLLTTAWIG